MKAANRVLAIVVCVRSYFDRVVVDMVAVGFPVVVCRTRSSRRISTLLPIIGSLGVG